MRLLDRYLLRELLIPLGYCLCGFLIFWIAADLFTELGHYQELKLRFGDVVQYELVGIPKFLVEVLPVLLLLALLYTLTNHARHHELTAIRAAGVSLGRLCAPYFVVGAMASLALLALNELWVPNSLDKQEWILNRRQEIKADAPGKDIRTHVGFLNSRDGRSWEIDAYNIKTHEMSRVHVDWNLSNGFRREVTAESADWDQGVWTFHNVREYEAPPGTHSEMAPILQTNLLAFPEFTETPVQIKREIAFNNRLNGKMLSAHSAEIPILEILDYLNLHPDLTPANRHWLETQLQDRLAKPWTCLVVVLIAIPFGAASGRRNVFVGVASSIVIVFAYIVLQRLGLALGTGGYLPAWIAAWLPNVSFAAAGLWMILQVR